MTTITFPQPCKRLSMNDRMHWAPKAKLTAQWRKAAATAARQQLGPAPSDRMHPPCLVRLSFPVKQNRRRDAHNAAPTIKACVDGLVDAGVWVDDSDDYVIVLDPRFHKEPADVVIVELIERGAIAS